MATTLQTPNVPQGSTAGWDVPLKADLVAVRDAADQAGITAGAAPRCVLYSGTAYPARPATTQVCFFIGPVTPLATGVVTGGGGMVPDLDQWFETP